MQGSICKGQAFLGANPQTERLTDFCDAVVRASGSQGYELQAPSNREYLRQQALSLRDC